MNAQEIRKAYLEFCQKNGHEIIERASLILKDDPTTLFTGSGMQPLLPYLLGEKHPKGARLTDSQTCLRAQDIGTQLFLKCWEIGLSAITLKSNKFGNFLSF